MTYATGSAATIPNVMDAMSTFAQANAGMTESKRRTENIINHAGASESMTVICLTKGTSNWWFAYGATDCQGFLADTNNGTVYHNTAGVQSSVTRIFPIAAPFTSYHLFTEGSVVHVAFEMSSGAWTHLNFGDITKYGAWTGGSYLGVDNQDLSGAGLTTFFGNGVGNAIFGGVNNFNPFGAGDSAQASKIRITKGSRSYGVFDGAPNLATNDGGTTPCCALAVTAGVIDALTRDSPNIFNNRAMGPRLEVFVSDTSVIFAGGTNQWLPIGFIPNIRFINVALLNPKDLINTDWMAFPIQSKTGSVGNFQKTSGAGLAVRK